MFWLMIHHDYDKFYSKHFLLMQCFHPPFCTPWSVWKTRKWEVTFQSSKILEKVVSQIPFVEGWSHQSHCNFLTYSHSRLKMMLPSFALQKMSGQVVRTHSLKLLLVWRSSIFIFLGPFQECLPPSLTGSSTTFYSVWSLVTLKVGRLFDFCGHDGAQRVAKPSLSCRWLIEIVGGDDLQSHLSFHSTSGIGQVVAGRLKKTQECPIEHAFGEMSHDCPRNTVSYLGQQLPGSDQTSRQRVGVPRVRPSAKYLVVVLIKGGMCHVSTGGVPCEARVSCHVYAQGWSLQ